jgi:hypothetical protein
MCFNVYMSVSGIRCSKGKTIKDLPVVVAILNGLSILVGLGGIYINKTIFTFIYTIINIILGIASAFGFDSC